MRATSLRTFGAVALMVTALTSPAYAAGDESLAPGEAALTARIIAPCCWNQTLDIHESEVASALRKEIHARLSAGESAQVIEDDLAARFGERIRAVPRGRDQRADLSIGLGIAVIVAAVALSFMVRGWRRRPASAPTESEAARVRDPEEDARLDEELRALDR